MVNSFETKQSALMFGRYSEASVEVKLKFSYEALFATT
jgi:hypothetical protein